MTFMAEICKQMEVFVYNTNLTFLYNIVIEGFKKFQKNIKLPPVEIELTALTITGFSGQCSSYSANLSYLAGLRLSVPCKVLSY